jgi:hypothetical protein
VPPYIAPEHSNAPTPHRRRWFGRFALLAVVGAALTAVVMPQASATAATSNGWTTTATNAPATVRRGDTVTIAVSVTSATTVSGLVDLEMYTSSGRVMQTAWTSQSFVAGQPLIFTTSWAVPANESMSTHTVKIGVFRPDWSQLLHWNDSARTFSVGAAGTTTTTAAPTTTNTIAATTTTTMRPTTTTTAATTTTVRPTTTTTIVSPTTVPGGTGRFATLPVGATLPTDASCASRVRKVAEVRPGNAAFNATKGSQGGGTGIYARVTGNFTGTTDELIQWASCKWGFDEDIIRAQVAVESWWKQSAAGDFTTDSSRCVPGHPIGADGHAGMCPESIGLLQLRYPYWTAAFPGATNSSAYNLDYALAARRSCFEGLDTWLNTVERGRTYAAGDLWGCMGVWFSGRWYIQSGINYTSTVQSYFNQRIWETSSFKAG